MIDLAIIIFITPKYPKEVPLAAALARGEVISIILLLTMLVLLLTEAKANDLTD